MTSFVFPGQGSQFIGMSRDFYDNFKVAKLTFDQIEDYTSLDLKKIIFEGKDNLINITKYTQICIFTASVAIYKTYESEKNIDLSNINIMLGHSLGEYTALACSNKLSLKDCSLILKKRGELMNDSVAPNISGMAALIGCDAETVNEIIKDNKMSLQIANDNSPIQVVISGNNDEIDRNKDIFLNNNIKKFIKLNVSAAFHSNLMFDAQKQLNLEIDKLNFNSNPIKIISNFTAEESDNNLVIKESLKNQMSNMVRWTDSIKKLLLLGETKIIELGPNKVLSGLIKRITDKIDIVSINNISDLGN